MKAADKKIIIIGAGFGGLASAVALRRTGFDTLVFDKEPEIKEPHCGMVLWPNACHALEHLGLLKAAQDMSSPVKTVQLRTPDGKILIQHDLGKFSEFSLCIHRADLHSLLRKSLPAGCLFLGRQFDNFEHQNGSIRARFTDGTGVNGIALIGADGRFSRVGLRLPGKTKPVYRGFRVWRGIAESAFADIGENTLCETWGLGKRFGFLSTKKRTYWFATENEKKDRPAQTKAHRERLLKVFADWHHPVIKIIGSTNDTGIVETPIYDRIPTKKWGSGAVTLLGDAAHMMTPDMAQGACMTIEDAVVLANCFKSGDNIRTALRRYESLRYRRTNTIARQSLLLSRLGQCQNKTGRHLRDLMIRLTPRALPQIMLNPVFSFNVRH